MNNLFIALKNFVIIANDFMNRQSMLIPEFKYGQIIIGMCLFSSLMCLFYEMMGGN